MSSVSNDKTISAAMICGLVELTRCANEDSVDAHCPVAGARCSVLRFLWMSPLGVYWKTIGYDYLTNILNAKV